MKTSSVLLALSLGLVVSASASAAMPSCSNINFMAWGANGPAVPPLERTTIDQVLTLGEELREYIRKEEALLEQCRGKVDAMRFNVRILHLEYRAEKYNELVRFYNRTLADAERIPVHSFVGSAE